MPEYAVRLRTWLQWSRQSSMGIWDSFFYHRNSPVLTVVGFKLTEIILSEFSIKPCNNAMLLLSMQNNFRAFPPLAGRLLQHPLRCADGAGTAMIVRGEMISIFSLPQSGVFMSYPDYPSALGFFPVAACSVIVAPC